MTLGVSRLGIVRTEYLKATLRRNDLELFPTDQFQKWLKEAHEANKPKILEPNAMALATCGLDGQPSLREVLLKHASNLGFLFFTNKKSRKAEDLNANPRAAALFYWPHLQRQVRIEGPVFQISDAESKRYFRSRPLEAQAASLSSRQSQPVDSRGELERTFAVYKKYLEENPEGDFLLDWGGYEIRPHTYEFWQGGEHRLHDRFQYTFKGFRWVAERLSP